MAVLSLIGGLICLLLALAMVASSGFSLLALGLGLIGAGLLWPSRS